MPGPLLSLGLGVLGSPPTLKTLSSKFEIWESANNVIGHSHNLHSQLSHCIQIWELEIKIQNTRQSEDTYEGETRSESRKLVFGCFCIVSS